MISAQVAPRSPYRTACLPAHAFANCYSFCAEQFRSMTDAIVVVDVPIIDKKGWTMRRDADDRMATVGRRNRAMIDHGYDLGVDQRQYTTCLQQFAPPVQREPISATPQELIISARSVDPQNVAAHIVL